MPLRVFVIVEGHGDEAAIRRLLERIWYELLGSQEYLEIKTWRGTQGQLQHQAGLAKIVEAAAIKLHSAGPPDLRHLLLIMTDTEGKECPKEIVPERIKWAREVRSDPKTEIAYVMPNPMFETWFAAAAQSLKGVSGLPSDLAKPADPEGKRVGKKWLKKQLGNKYQERVDQVTFADRMDLRECMDASRSFRKLVKEFTQRL